MVDYKSLEALATIVREGSFEKAAERLCLTQSAVSQRLKQAEQIVGQTLLIRGQPPGLTETGEIAMKHFRQWEMLNRDFAQELGLTGHSTSRTQRISIGTNADSLALWLLSALDSVLKEKNILLDLKVDDQEKTHELLRKGEVFACITAKEEAEKGCNCFPIGVMTYQCLVAPEFYDRYFKEGVNAETVLEAPCVEFNENDKLETQYLNTYFGLAGPVRVNRIPSTEVFLDFIEKGHAWGLVPEIQAEQQIIEQKVVEMLPGCRLEVPLYWHIWNLKTELSRSLTKEILDAGARILK